MAITTLVSDTRGPGAKRVQPVTTTTVTLAYDSSGKEVRRADFHDVITTITYLDTRFSVVDQRPRIESRAATTLTLPERWLVDELLILLKAPPRVGKPLWWHVWRTVAESQWLRLEQLAIATRLARQQFAIEEMCQFSTIHFGRVFERWPSLGLQFEEVPSQFPRRARRIIRRDFITWLRLRTSERRRIAPWPTSDFVHVWAVELIDRIEIGTAMAELPPLHRHVIEMRSFGYRRAEIARALDCSVYKVDRIFRACRRHLQVRLKSLQPE